MVKKYVTLKDIAEEIDLAITTVSKALRDHPDINIQTKKNVKKVAKEMGYIKNLSASSLKSNKSNTIGVILSDNSNPFFQQIMTGIEEEAQKKDYKIIYMNSQGEEEKEKNAIKSLLEYRVDGLIIFPLQNIKEYKKYQIGKNSVLVSWTKGYKIIDSVSVKEREAFYLATEHLIKTGRKNILFMDNFLYKTGYCIRRFEGYKDALKDYGIKFKEENHITRKDLDKSHRINEGYFAMQEVLNQGKKFDGIVCFNDLMAYGVIKSLHEAQIKIPDQVGIVGFDDLDFSTIIHPSLTSVGYNVINWGRESFKTLLKRLDNPTSAIKNVELDVSISIRGSTKK